MLGPLLAAFALLAPQEVPPNDGWVTDRAGLFSEYEQRELEELLDSYRHGSGHEIAVLTVASLDGGSIERLALDTGRAWKVGREGENDGALLVVAKAERELHIGVGRGLEGELTDIECGSIIRKVIVPRFKQGDYHAGVRAGLQAMFAAIEPGSPGVTGVEGAKRRVADGLTALAALAFFGFVVLVRVRSLRRRGPRSLSRGLGRSGFPPILFGGPFGGSGGGFSGGGFSGGGFGGFGGGGGFSGGGASGRW